MLIELHLAPLVLQPLLQAVDAAHQPRHLRLVIAGHLPGLLRLASNLLLQMDDLCLKISPICLAVQPGLQLGDFFVQPGDLAVGGSLGDVRQGSLRLTRLLLLIILRLLL